LQSEVVGAFTVSGAQSVRIASTNNSTLTSVQMQATFTVEIFGIGLRDDDKISMTHAASCGGSGAMMNSQFLRGTSYVATTPGEPGSTADATTSRLFSFNSFVEADVPQLTVKICWCPGSTGCSLDTHFGVNLDDLRVFK
jgi:hypothetical protein